MKHSFTETLPRPALRTGQYLQRIAERINTVLEDGRGPSSLPALDGVRALACLAIISFHMNLIARFSGIWQPALDGIGAYISAALLFGESGVILFFVLSGFLLFLPYARALLFDTEWPSLRRFFVRRALRIFPAYYLALFIMLLILNPAYLAPSHLHDLWLFLTFRMDFPATFQQLNAPFWTLAIEFQYYVALPFIAYALRLLVKRGNPHWRMLKLSICLLSLLLWGFATRYWGLFLAPSHPLDTLIPPTDILFSPIHTLNTLIPPTLAETLKPYIYGQAGKFYEVFAIGMLISMLYTYLQRLPAHIQTLTRKSSPLFLIMGLLLLWFVTLWHFYMLFIGQTLHFFDPYRDTLLTYRDLLQPILYGLAYGLCLYALLTGPKWLQRPLTIRPLRWLGLLSYSLYIWHYALILHFITFFLPQYQRLNWSPFYQGLSYWLWLILTALPISITLYRYVELPGMRYSDRLCQRLTRPRQPSLIPTSTVPDLIPSNTSPSPLLIPTSPSSPSSPNSPIPALVPSNITHTHKSNTP